MSKLSPNEPWLHTASGFWCKKVAGKLHYLDRDYRAAKRKLAKILRDRDRVKAGAQDWLSAPFANLCDEFLERKSKGSTTYRDYRYRLVRALRVLDRDLRVAAVNEGHLEDLEQRLREDGLSPSSIRDTLATMQSVFKWALRRQMIAHDPLAGYAKPIGRSRNRIVTPTEFQALLRASASNRPFQRVLLALRRTGCRPGEVRTLTWEMVDFENRVWIIPDHKTIDRQEDPRPRIVPLPDCIWKMCRWLRACPDSHDTHVFVNAWGRPYTKDRLVKCMDRVRKRAGIVIKAGEQLVLYSQRHTYATNAYGKVGDIALAELMGHTDVRTTRRYAHLNTTRLHEYQRAIQANGPTRESA